MPSSQSPSVLPLPLRPIYKTYQCHCACDVPEHSEGVPNSMSKRERNWQFFILRLTSLGDLGIFFLCLVHANAAADCRSKKKRIVAAHSNCKRGLVRFAYFSFIPLFSFSPYPSSPPSSFLIADPFMLNRISANNTTRIRNMAKFLSEISSGKSQLVFDIRRTRRGEFNNFIRQKAQNIYWEIGKTLNFDFRRLCTPWDMCVTHV